MKEISSFLFFLKAAQWWQKPQLNSKHMYAGRSNVFTTVDNVNLYSICSSLNRYSWTTKIRRLISNGHASWGYKTAAASEVSSWAKWAQELDLFIYFSKVIVDANLVRPWEPLTLGHAAWFIRFHLAKMLLSIKRKPLSLPSPVRLKCQNTDNKLMA